ncbi:YSIRK-type signal peptide-containing protein, partial [Enterococcus faecium]|uniref:YSIRK-type signal peptide-containing protein n=1 Tax=Enterococcus faecium TaxID=1352 RepID=UPI001F1865A7
MLQYKNSDKKQRFTIRKLSIGTVSVLAGTLFFVSSGTVSADTTKDIIVTEKTSKPVQITAEAPASTVKAEVPASTVKAEAPASTVKAEAPASTVKAEAPASTVKAEAPASTV